MTGWPQNPGTSAKQKTTLRGDAGRELQGRPVQGRMRTGAFAGLCTSQPDSFDRCIQTGVQTRSAPRIGRRRTGLKQLMLTLVIQPRLQVYLTVVKNHFCKSHRFSLNRKSHPQYQTSSVSSDCNVILFLGSVLFPDCPIENVLGG